MINTTKTEAIDPICGMTVDKTTALHEARDGETFFFCSEHCREKFTSRSAPTKADEMPPGKAIYTCPMHPKVQQDHPGACPKCGMTLEPSHFAAKPRQEIDS